LPRGCGEPTETGIGDHALFGTLITISPES